MDILELDAWNAFLDKREKCMLVRNPSVLWRELDGEAILLDPQAGCSYTLNPVGTLIWKLLDGEHSKEDIVAAICEAYEVEPEQASQDARHLLDELRSNKLASIVQLPV